MTFEEGLCCMEENLISKVDISKAYIDFLTGTLQW
jgi:hypothetical protein